MLYKVPEVHFDSRILTHPYQTLTEENGFGQARRTRVFPQNRNINTSIRLKDGRTLRPRTGSQSGLSGLSFNYAQKSTPYMGTHSGRTGLGNFITDAVNAVTKTVTGTVNTISGTVSGVSTPIEKMLADNPSLLNLVKGYLPQPAPPQGNVVYSMPATQPSTTMGVSNKAWMIGAVGLGSLALLKVLRSK